MSLPEPPRPPDPNDGAAGDAGGPPAPGPTAGPGLGGVGSSLADVDVASTARRVYATIGTRGVVAVAIGALLLVGFGVQKVVAGLPTHRGDVCGAKLTKLHHEIDVSGAKVYDNALFKAAGSLGHAADHLSGGGSEVAAVHRAGKSLEAVGRSTTTSLYAIESPLGVIDDYCQSSASASSASGVTGGSSDGGGSDTSDTSDSGTYDTPLDTPADTPTDTPTGPSAYVDLNADSGADPSDTDSNPATSEFVTCDTGPMASAVDALSATLGYFSGGTVPDASWSKATARTVCSYVDQSTDSTLTVDIRSYASASDAIGDVSGYGVTVGPDGGPVELTGVSGFTGQTTADISGNAVVIVSAPDAVTNGDPTWSATFADTVMRSAIQAD